MEGTADVSGTSNTYFMNHHDASIVPGGLAKERLLINGLRLATGDFNIGYTESILLFLNKSMNAVVRSFEESGGQGLPGFVQSLSFDWISDNSTWEVERGARAPKVFKVSVQFTPVHDIAPGLDHLGYNRAPVYPVGDVVNTINGKSGDVFEEAVEEYVQDKLEGLGAGAAATALNASNVSNAVNGVKSYVTNKFEDWTS